MIRKAFKFRIYPDSEQQDKLAVQFGCSRFVYNHYRSVREEYYHETKTGLTYNDCATDLTERLKEDCPWLKDADSQVIQQSLMDLDKAYKNFFEGRADYPNFKRKFDKQSIRYPQRFKLDGGHIYLPKVGWVRVVLHRKIEGKMKNITVSKTKTGKYFVAIQCEVAPNGYPAKPAPSGHPKPAQVGIDLGLTTFAAFSTGEKIDKPKHFYASERRLKIRQRRLSCKVKGSNSRNKARLVVATTHEKIANQRKDFHHKLSRTIVDHFGTVAFESLNIGGMLKNHNLAKAIADAGWNQFVSFVEYKATWAGAEVLRVERFFPSSKLCSDCGEKNQNLTLNLRQWVCTSCGVIHDRDENAAVNILRQSSVQVLNESTRGARESYAVGDMSSAVRLSAPEKFQVTGLEAQVL
ncbi:MAG: transposase [Caldilinea sp. CFX5]|nr:transposase [Caldilinea sp. CFX5]